MTRSDHQSLSRLAESRAARDPDLSEQLLAELDRARVVEDRRIAADVVRMGSTLPFTTDAGEDRTVTLVFPGEADREPPQSQMSASPCRPTAAPRLRTRSARPPGCRRAAESDEAERISRPW